jgi:hypothetical protein
MKSEQRKLTRKLLLLLMMISGLVFFSTSRTVSASYYCDTQYAQCMQTCGQPIDQICAYNCAQEREWCEFWID